MPAGQTNPYPDGTNPNPNPNTPTGTNAPPTNTTTPPTNGDAKHPTAAWLREYAKQQNWSEDFARFSDKDLTAWLAKWWDPNAKMFRTRKTDRNGGAIEGFVEKPDDLPEGWIAWGANNQAVRKSDLANLQGGGNGSGNNTDQNWNQNTGGGGTWTIGPNGYPIFTPPTFEQAQNDPGYQFSLQQGINALQGSAAAQGTLRTGGTLQGIMGLGQQMAANRYSDVFNRGLNAFGANSANWGTHGGWGLSKWTTTENNIANALNSPPPTPPTQ